MQFHWAYKWGISNKLILRIEDSDLLRFWFKLTKNIQKSYKNIGICNIGYIAIKKFDDYEIINNANPLYLIIVKADGYIQENNENKYLVFTSTEVTKKY